MSDTARVRDFRPEDVVRMPIIEGDVVVVVDSAVLIFHDSEVREGRMGQHDVLFVEQPGECLKVFHLGDVKYWSRVNSDEC
jgi:hypothetical protein